MEVGFQMAFTSYGWTNISDTQVWDEEIALARLAADTGFDVVTYPAEPEAPKSSHATRQGQTTLAGVGLEPSKMSQWRHAPVIRSVSP
jgi:hypothetical protein